MNGFAFKAQNTTRAAVSIVSLFVLSLLAVSLAAEADVPNTLESDDSTGPTRAGDWVQEGFDPGHTSFNRLETELSPENVGNLVKLWESSVGGGLPFCGPVVRDGKVYIGSGAAGDGRMYAFDAATGATLWVGESQAPLFFSATAAVGHGLVFANAFNSPFLAYDAETGEIAWNSGLGGIKAAPTLQGRRLYLFGADDLVHALDPETGTEIWSQNPGGPNTGQAPVVLNGRVFQSACVRGGLTAYDAQTGEILWHKNACSGAGVVATQGRLFFRGTFEGGSDSVIALDAATGELIWETPTLPGSTSAVPAVAYGMVFVTFVDLIALDARTGVEVWRVPGVHSNTGPSVANGVVYASNLSGEWDAFDARNGALLWSVVIPGCGGTCTNAIPVVANGRLYLAGPDQFLRAYGLPR